MPLNEVLKHTNLWFSLCLETLHLKKFRISTLICLWLDTSKVADQNRDPALLIPGSEFFASYYVFPNFISEDYRVTLAYPGVAGQRGLRAKLQVKQSKYWIPMSLVHGRCLCLLLEQGACIGAATVALRYRWFGPSGRTAGIPEIPVVLLSFLFSSLTPQFLGQCPWHPYCRIPCLAEVPPGLPRVTAGDMVQGLPSIH
jgi:hypothetical protein